MAHLQQKQFCTTIKNRFPTFFINKNVLDCGSLDINGNNRYLFENCSYLGIDVGVGCNVDIITPIHEFQYPDSSFDFIISTECFEHDLYYEKSLKNICRLLKSGGMFLFTCATIGRKEHGTERTSPSDSPFTSNIIEWSNYYKNLDEMDIRIALNIDEIFITYEFGVELSHHDLTFWGIKK